MTAKNADAMKTIEALRDRLRDASAGINDRSHITVTKATVEGALHAECGITPDMLIQVANGQAALRDAATLFAAEEAANNVKAALSAGNSITDAAPGIVSLRGPTSIEKITVFPQRTYPNPQDPTKPVVVNGQVNIRVDTHRGANPEIAKLSSEMIRAAGGITA